MDLTSLVNIKAYGDVLKTSDDAVITGLIPALSKAVENYCDQSFGAATLTQLGTGQSFNAVIDRDGLLTFYPPYNPVNAVTALQYRTRGLAGWQALDPTQLDIENLDCGPVVRLYGYTSLFQRIRAMGGRVQVQANFMAGYADLDALPADLEFAVRRLVWWAYKKRSAAEEKTAIPEMGVLVIPNAWPPDVAKLLVPYMRYFTH
jgi:hypothetical protein